jgi:glycosyltransferase involved in cell wall biosynthesis
MTNPVAHPLLFSIVTIHFNDLEGLRRTADSIMGQTERKAFEWIVIDGGSTDGSVAYLEGLGDRIDVLVSEKDGGIYDAMNKGLERCKGVYVWFMNAGDTIHAADVVERLVGELPAELPDVIFGDTEFMDEAGRPVGLISKLKPQPFPSRLHGGSFRYGMNICHQSFLAKRSLSPKFDLQYRQAADVDWIIQILKRMRGQSFRSSLVISNFELGGSSAQHTQKAWKERYLVLQRHYGWLPNLFAHGWILFRRLLFNLKLLGK